MADQSPDLICYCFGYSRRDIIEELQQCGTSQILTRIVAEKKDGNCQCASKNPKGR